MRINTSSWHYRLIKFTTPSRLYIPEDLCQYFWALVRSFLVCFVLIGAATGFVLLLVLAPLMLWLTGSVHIVLLGSYVFSWAITIAVIIELFIPELNNHPFWGKRLVPKIHTHNKEKRTSLLRMWWQAKKERVCPRLEFVDDE